MSIRYQTKLNRLLSAGVPGGVYFSEWLSKNEYSPQLIQRYKEYGWLESLTSGVLYRRNEKPSALAAVYSFSMQIGKPIRIAAHSALELHGISHYIPLGKPKLVVSFDPYKPKQWIRSDKFDMEIVPFSSVTFSNPRTQTLKKYNLSIPVSTPEQGFLECLHLVPSHYNYMDLYYLMEQLTSLDSSGVQQALENSTSQRVKRMFLYMAEKAGHYWVEMLDKEKLGITDSKLQLVKNGVYIPEYKITIPKELKDYE